MAAVIAAEGFHMAEYQRGIKEMKVLLIIAFLIVTELRMVVFHVLKIIC